MIASFSRVLRASAVNHPAYRRFACGGFAGRVDGVSTAPAGVIEEVGIPGRTDESLMAPTGAVAPGAAATAATPTGVAWLPRLVFNVNSKA